MTDLSGMGINITENEEPEYSDETQEQSSSTELVANNTETENIDKTDDPVRMYLREMGSVELPLEKVKLLLQKGLKQGENL